VTDASRKRVELALKMVAPYLAVGVFWIYFHNGWLALLTYHAQILWWSRGRLAGLVRPHWTPLSLLVVPAALTGPVLYFALPYITRIDLGAWLARYQLTGAGLLAMVFYYGFVHPVIEQTHWAPLRERTPVAHVAFAGYHVLVLYSLLPVPWLAVSFGVLATVSWLWERLARESGSLLPAIASHVAADLGMIVVAWMSR
jgi:hypothetical protein